MSDSEDQKPDLKSLRGRRTRACKQCHSLKVRCIPVDENNLMSPCVRCVNSNRTCEIDSIEPRKRRKRTPKPEKDTVAELKNQILELQKQLAEARAHKGPQLSLSVMNGLGIAPSQSPGAFALDSSSPPFMTRTDLEREVAMLSEANVSLQQTSDEINEHNEMRQKSLLPTEPLDVVSKGIIGLDAARERLDMYRTILYTSHPFVNVPDHLTVEDMMRDLPFLLNAVMAVTSTINRNDTNFQLTIDLDSYAVTTVVTEIMVRGTKSVEMVKSLTLLSIWYNTPELFKSRRYHILNNVAVTLLHDLGIVASPTFDYTGDSRTIKKKTGFYEDFEYRIMILTLYSSTVGICLVLRRTIFVKWTEYVEECCSVLEKSDNVFFQKVALFLRLNHELEVIHHLVHSPEVFRNKVRISNYTLDGLTTRLAVIRSRLPKGNHLLLANLYSVEAYLYQPVSDDLQVQSIGLKRTEELSNRTLRTISQCTASCLFSMDEFNQLTEEEIAGLPLFHFSRIIYTTGILMRLRYFILSLPSHIEKDLVPRHAISAVLALNEKIHEVSKKYPTNFLIKRMKLVLRLFIQTYCTQVDELIEQSGGGSRVSGLAIDQKDFKQMRTLANSLMSQHQSQMSLAGPPEAPGLHLDLLSYAANEHLKTGDARLESSTSPLPEQKQPKQFPGTSPTVPEANGSKAFEQPPPSQPAINGNQQLYPEFPRPGFPPRNSFLQQMPGDPNMRAPNNHGIQPNRPFYGNERAKGDTIYEFDDEFWSNLLTADSNTYLFAPNLPMANDSVLSSIFN